jgi:four helix bundle protein
MALGSASEVEYHLLLAHDLGLLPDPDFERLTSSVVEVKRMLNGRGAAES